MKLKDIAKQERLFLARHPDNEVHIRRVGYDSPTSIILFYKAEETPNSPAGIGITANIGEEFAFIAFPESEDNDFTVIKRIEHL